MRLQCLQADGLNKLQKGDFSDVLHDLLTNAVSITAPVFFSSATDLFQSQFAAISFGFTGFQYSPCAIPVTPLGIGIFPQVMLTQAAPEGAAHKPRCFHGRTTLQLFLFKEEKPFCSFFTEAQQPLCHESIS